MTAPMDRDYESGQFRDTTHPDQSTSTNYLAGEPFFAAFTKSVVTAKTEIKEFTDLMKGEESKKVFKQSEKRAAKESTGIKPWRYRDHPDWLDLDS
jgi:hypothetical protein